MEPEKTGQQNFDIDAEKTGQQDFDTDNEKTGQQDFMAPPESTGQMNKKVTRSSDNPNMKFLKEYHIDGIKYKYKDAISIGKSGEADVILVSNSNSKYALKLYHEGYSPNQDILAQIKALKSSGFVVPLYSFGIIDNPLFPKKKQPYELMAYVPGKSLAEYPLNKDEKLLKKIALNAAICLNMCHSKHILHKDVKPGNFFVADTSDCTLMLADFGASVMLDSEQYAYTKQDGTTTYNAPEMYNVAGGRARLSTKSDFYSLGIMLMCIWMGEAKFRVEMGDKAGRDRMFDLRKKKDKGELPYPEDLSDDLLMLIKGLTLPDEEKRWGFEEVKKWSAGEMKYSDAITRSVPFVFDEKKGKVAHNPEELAAFMIEDQKYAIKIIRRGKVTDWLHECNYDNLATNISDVADNVEDGEACVAQTVFLLNPDLPYPYGEDGEQSAFDLEDLVEAVYSMDIDTLELTDKNSLFYSFLVTHGGEDLIDKCMEIVDEEYNDNRWMIAYTIDPNQPYKVYDEEEEDWITCETLQDVPDVYKKYNGNLYTDDIQILLSDVFLDWVREQDEEVYDKIQNEIVEIERPDDEDGSEDEDYWCVLYNLDLRRSYELTLTKKEGECHKKIEEIADLINKYAVDFYCKAEVKDNKSAESETASDFIYNLRHLKGKRMHYYLLSKGCFQKQIEWIEYCFELDSKTNMKKCMPYKESTAVWKTIKGLIGNDKYPYFLVEGSKKTIHSLNELKSLPQNGIVKSIDNGSLEPWLSVFFHENPFADLQQKGNFELLAADYIKFIGEVNPNYPPYKRFEDAQNSVDKLVLKGKGLLTTTTILNAIVAGVSVIMIAVFIFMLFRWSVPKGLNPVEGLFWEFAICGIPFGIVAHFTISKSLSFMQSILTGIIWFIGAFLIMKFIFPFLQPWMPWIGIIISLLLGYATYKILSIKDIIETRHFFTYMDYTDMRIIQPLFYSTKSSDATFDNSYDSILNIYSNKLKDCMRKTTQFIPILLVFVGMIYLKVRITPDLGGNNIAKEQMMYQNLSGSWEGSFNAHPATLNITDATKQQVKATIKVQFKKEVSESFTGTLNDSCKLTLTDNEPNGKLDGTFIGYIDDSQMVYKGKYTNIETGKTYLFQFNKKQE
jgi:serine/threonine protein kinase